jgi:hypothetical protein
MFVGKAAAYKKLSSAPLKGMLLALPSNTLAYYEHSNVLQHWPQVQSSISCIAKFDTFKWIEIQSKCLNNFFSPALKLNQNKLERSSMDKILA